MPACFRQDAVGKTLINVCYCDIAKTVLYVNYAMDIFLNKRLNVISIT